MHVFLYRLEMPPANVLSDGEALEAWLAENNCELAYPAETIGWLAWEKIKDSPMVVKYIEDEVVDWPETFESLGLGEFDNWMLKAAGTDPGVEWNFVNGGRKVTVRMDQLKFKSAEVRCLCHSVEDLGHVDIEPNASFISDGKLGGDNVILSRDRLEEDWRKYFKSSKKFKSRILDKFEDGKTVVLYV